MVAVVFFGAILFAHEASADSINQSQQYRVNSFYDISGATSITSTLRAIGSHAYFYVDDRYWSYLTVPQQEQFASALQTLSQQFDDTIYPRSVALWGSEANPGVDGDSHVVIVLQRVISGSGGYFESIHNYPKDRAPNSNAREMIFINAESVLGGSARTFVTHEFQHLISFGQRELMGLDSDDIWLNEARSEYGITSAGYSAPFEASTLQRRQQSFLRTPSDSLTEWPNTASDYAIATMFVHYIADRFGVDAVTSTILSRTTGTLAIEDWLTTHSDKHFPGVFVDWMVAAALNDRTSNPAYGYTMAGLSSFRVRPMTTLALSEASGQVSFASSLKEWQPYWASIDVFPGYASVSDARIRVDGAPDAQWYGVAIARYQGGRIVSMPLTSVAGVAESAIALRSDGVTLQSVQVMLTQGVVTPIAARSVLERSATVSLALGAVTPAPLISVSPTTSPVPDIRYVRPVDGDLIRRAGQEEIYVVWGAYRRLLTTKILALYGFQDRPVREVPDDVFFRYSASVYIRAQGAKQVYAVWSDNTKHWFDITAAQWEASHRDWGAIFTVNDAEVAAYATGASITR